MSERISLPVVFVFGLAVIANHVMADEPLRTMKVKNADGFSKAIIQARPGDEIVIANGAYFDWELDLTCSGSAVNRILVRAETPGQAVFSGDSHMRIRGDFVTVSGLNFKDGETDGEIWRVSSSHARITECALIDYKDGGHKWIRFQNGTENRLDHCAISGKTEHGVTFQIDVSEDPESNRHRVDHNYFGPRARGRGNGWETIRNGYSHQQNLPARSVFEHNLFHRCDGENEIISSKSSRNIYRYNTFLECAGELTLRHGKHNQVYGNFFFGRGKRGSAGIRVIGEGHRVVNNYIENTRGAGIHVYEGEDEVKATGYQAANDVLIAFNTIVGNGGNGIHVKDYERSPRRIVIANNLVAGNEQAVSKLSAEQLSESYSFHGNIAWNNPVDSGLPNAAFQIIDPRLVRGNDGVLRPAENSPALGAAAREYEDFDYSIDLDLDGQRRIAARDVGADQVDGAGDKVNRPLTVSDIGGAIGPSWLTVEELRVE